MLIRLERLYRRWWQYLIVAVLLAVVGVAELTIRHYKVALQLLLIAGLIGGWALFHLRPMARSRPDG